MIYLYLPLRTSATNCSRIYNEGFNNSEINPFLPATWFYSLKMRVDDVWNGFFIHCLLLDHEEWNATLQLTHTAQSQSKRLQPALKARNARMRGPGQEHWNHACDLCCWVYTDSDDVKRKYINRFSLRKRTYLSHQGVYGLLLSMGSAWAAPVVVILTAITISSPFETGIVLSMLGRV
jgi:hypothetical protein